MSETRRPVTVDVVYDGDECSLGCPFLSENNERETFCMRFTRDEQMRGLRVVYHPSTKEGRCDECKAEDLPAKPQYPKE